MSWDARLKRISRLVDQHTMLHLPTQRSLIMWPILGLFILGSCWGLADPAIELPSGIEIVTPADVLFIASGFILLSATLGVVLAGFDGISRKRMSGVLSVELSQPTQRSDLAISLLLGTWATVAIPTFVLSLLGVLLIHQQMGIWPSLSQVTLFLVATGLVLLWYASIQLLASTWAKDMGSAISLGIGTWMLFTMLWVLVTVIVAYLQGVSITDTTDSGYLTLSGMVDLFSPNGVYQMLLENHLRPIEEQRIDPIYAWIAALGWTILPAWLFIRRFGKLS